MEDYFRMNNLPVDNINDVVCFGENLHHIVGLPSLYYNSLFRT